MRLFIATLSTETNTFSAMPTAMSGFEAYFLRHGDATGEAPNLMTEALHVWRHRAEAIGWEVTESLAAIAEPAGRTTAACYAALRGEILRDLENAGGADVILLQLHGAMVADGVDDCEGDLLDHVRRACPEATIGVSLDPHCHLTPQMLGAADLILCFKEYPHDDASDRAHELFDLAQQAAAGRVRPVMRDFDCGMIHLYLTKAGAMRGFVDRMTALEAEPGILSVSLVHGFPWADVERVGARVLVVTDGDAALAATTAEALGRAFYDLRDAVTLRPVPLDDALSDAAQSPERPVVLADMGDNSGGGAPGDSTFVLQAILARSLSRVATGIYWDPVVVGICVDAGIGAELRLRLGGKVSVDSGDPVDITARVMNIASGLGQHLGKGREPLGTVVWLRTGDEVDILVNDLRTQVYHPEAFTQMGIDLTAKSIITVKSLFHFYAPFQVIAPRIIQMATPGGTCPDFRALTYTKRGADYWPRNEP